MSDVDDGIGELLAQSEALGAVGRYDAAAERAGEAARRDPQDPRAYWAWASALHGGGHFADAARMADESIRLAPESAQGFRLRSIALSSLARSLPKGEREQVGADAAQSAREAVRLEPHSANSQLALAGALSLTGDLPDADRAMQEVFRLAPNSAASWVTASVVAIRAKNWDAAISASRRALEIDPDNYAALNNLGVALRASGKRREGTRVLADAARANPDGRLARQNLSHAGLRTVRVAILILLLPLGFLTHSGVLLYLVFAIGSNVVISKNPELALRLERVGAPVALFLAGKRRGSRAEAPSDGPSGRPPAAPTEQTWSAMDGHQMHAISNSLLIFGAVAAWSVALMMVIVLVRPGSSKPGVAIAFVVCAALGGLAVWTVRRRKQKGRAWARALVAEKGPTVP